MGKAGTPGHLVRGFLFDLREQATPFPENPAESAGLGHSEVLCEEVAGGWAKHNR